MPSLARRRSPSTTVRPTRRGLAPLALGLLVAMGASLAGVLPAALAAPGGNKVTICHRTHSVTNPYRMITVSASAADGAGKSDHTSHNKYFSIDGETHRVFNPEVAYPSNQKWWGDIIPPLRKSPGLNWSEPRAQAIYTGTGASFGLCGRMSAYQFYKLEVDAGVPASEVLADLDEQQSAEDAALLESLGVAEFSKLNPDDLPDTFEKQVEAPKGAPAPASVTPEKGKQKLTVFVWYDTNRNGAVDAGEQPASGIPVSIGEVVDLAPAGFAPASTFVMGAGRLMTDANGLIVDESITAGQWEAAAVTPETTEVTYDSEGTVDDGAAVVEVPADSTGFAWIGLVTLAVDDPTPGDPTPGDPTSGDPTPGDPTPGDPTPADPTPGDPETTDPDPSDSGSNGPGTGDDDSDGDEKGAFAFADGPKVSAGGLARTGGPLDAATLAVGAGALVLLGVALARRASNARRRSLELVEAD